MLQALKMDKSKSANFVKENEFEFRNGLHEADDDDLLQNPLQELDEVDLLDSIHNSLIPVRQPSLLDS